MTCQPRKARKQFLLDPRKLSKAKRIVGAKTETEAVDRALDAIIENERLERAHQGFSTSGARIEDVFERLGQ